LNIPGGKRNRKKKKVRFFQPKRTKKRPRGPTKDQQLEGSKRKEGYTKKKKEDGKRVTYDGE